jgi:hypothetical protein
MLPLPVPACARVRTSALHGATRGAPHTRPTWSSLLPNSAAALCGAEKVVGQLAVAVPTGTWKQASTWLNSCGTNGRQSTTPAQTRQGAARAGKACGAAAA